MRRIVIFAGCLLVSASGGYSSELSAVSPEQSATWIRYTVPLPKEIEITHQLSCRPDQVAIKVAAYPDPLVRHAVEELQESMGISSETKRNGVAAYTIVLQQGGADASDLRELKNSEQAYRIAPLKDGAGVKLVGIAPHGLYYAAKTLGQLIKAKAADGKVTMPILLVRDWPDMADRGLWGADTTLHIRWLSDRKYNYMEQVATNGVDKDGKATLTMNPTRGRMLVEGPGCGIEPVPALVHLEHLGKKGIYEVFPDLKAKGEGVHEGAACYSNPKIVELLADWMVGCARLGLVTEVDSWMTENLERNPVVSVTGVGRKTATCWKLA